MPREPLIDDEGEARELTAEDFDAMETGEPDVTHPLSLPKTHTTPLVTEAQDAVAEMRMRARQLRSEADQLDNAAERLERGLPPGMRRTKVTT